MEFFWLKISKFSKKAFGRFIFLSMRCKSTFYRFILAISTSLAVEYSLVPCYKIRITLNKLAICILFFHWTFISVSLSTKRQKAFFWHFQFIEFIVNLQPIYCEFHIFLITVWEKFQNVLSEKVVNFFCQINKYILIIHWKNFDWPFIYGWICTHKWNCKHTVIDISSVRRPWGFNKIPYNGGWFYWFDELSMIFGCCYYYYCCYRCSWFLFYLYRTASNNMQMIHI